MEALTLPCMGNGPEEFEQKRLYFSFWVTCIVEELMNIYDDIFRNRLNVITEERF